MKHFIILFFVVSFILSSHSYAGSAPSMGGNPLGDLTAGSNEALPQPQTPPPAVPQAGGVPAMPDMMMGAGAMPNGAGATSEGGNVPVQNIPLSIESIKPEMLVLKRVEDELRAKFKANIYSPANLPSLFFTPQQQALLNSARQGFIDNFEGVEEDVAASSSDEASQVQSVKEIILGGIVYTNEKDWTIWLNGARTTAATLPKQVLEIKVSREFVELKWFDEATNQIFPVRLRPNQKFDLTNKVFLPAG